MAYKKSKSYRKIQSKKIPLTTLLCYPKEYFCSENATTWMIKQNENIDLAPDKMHGEGCYEFDTCYEKILKDLGYVRRSSNLSEVKQSLLENKVVMVSIVPDSNLFDKKGNLISKDDWQRHSIVIIGFDENGIVRLESGEKGCYKSYQKNKDFLREWNRVGGEQKTPRLAILKKGRKDI